MTSMCVNPSANGVGASTAIFGLVGFYFVYFFKNFGYIPHSTLIMLLIHTWQHGNPRIDFVGHLGGFLTGTLVGLAISEQ